MVAVHVEERQGPKLADAGIVTTVRAIESNILADDGQIIVLGGLIQDNEDHGEEKVRGLGDIPVLGQLFRQSSQLRSQKELLIFITPRIVADLAAAGAIPMR